MRIIALIFSELVQMFSETFSGLFKAYQKKTKEPPWLAYNKFMKFAERNDKGQYVLKFKFPPAWKRCVGLVLCGILVYGSILLLIGEKGAGFIDQFIMAPFIIILFYYILEKGSLNLLKEPECHTMLDNEGISMLGGCPFKILWNDIGGYKTLFFYTTN